MNDTLLRGTETNGIHKWKFKLITFVTFFRTKYFSIFAFSACPTDLQKCITRKEGKCDMPKSKKKSFHVIYITPGESDLRAIFLKSKPKSMFKKIIR